MARQAPPPRGPQLDLAGALCVAFVNTAGAREKKNRQLGVKDYDELVAWSVKSGVLAALEAERLGRVAAARPVAAEAAFAHAIEQRSALFRLFLAVSAERQLPAADLATVNAALSGAMASARLVDGESGIVWGWTGDEEALDRMLWPVLLSAAELLISVKGRPQVRQCAGAGCTLFFVDRTPSSRRVWCSMKACGSRAKSLRYYHRTGKNTRTDFW